MELRKNAHSVGESCLHLQFTIAYRREVLRIRQLLALTKIYLYAAANRIGVEIAAMDFGPDHVHLFITNWKNYSVAELAKRLKGFSSRMIRKRYMGLIQHYLWGSKFWTSGYFYRTVGSVTSENMKRYIEETQEKHWS